jgi:hypothetical protein
MHEPPVLSSATENGLGTVFEEDEELLENLPTEFWTPATDTWSPPSPASATRWDLPEGPVERVRYDACACTWARKGNTAGLPLLVFANFLASNDNAPESTSENPAGRTEEEEMAAASSLEEGSAVSTSDEMEEGEVRDEPHGSTARDSSAQDRTADFRVLVRTADPCLQSQADAVLIPAIGSGRRGAIITRSCYSSSASPVSSDSTTHPFLSGHRSITSSPLTIAEKLLKVERIVSAVVHHVTPGANTISSPLKTSLTLPQPHLKGDALFELEYDTDSPPELLKADSSDERDSLDDHSIHSEETVIVRTVDCLEALAQMRQEAPTPDRNPEL